VQDDSIHIILQDDILGKHIAGHNNILQDDRVNSYRGTCTNPLTIIFSRGRGVVLCCHP